MGLARRRSRAARRRRRLGWSLFGVAAVAVLLVALSPQLGWHIGHLGGDRGGSADAPSGSHSGGSGSSRSGSGSGKIVTSASTVGPAASLNLRARTLMNPGTAASVAQGSGVAFASDDRNKRVVSFDPTTGRVVRAVPLAGPPDSMLLAAGDLWVAEPTVNELVELNPSSLFVVRIVVLPVAPDHLAVLGATMWVTSTDYREVTPVALATGAVGKPVGVFAGAIDVESGFGALWVTGLTDLVTRIVPTFVGDLQRVVAVGQGAISLGIGPQSVWAANARTGTVSQIDPVSLQVTATFPAGFDPSYVAVAGDGRVFVASGSGQDVEVVSPAPGSNVLHIAAQPRQMVPVANGVWVAGTGPAVVSVS